MRVTLRRAAIWPEESTADYVSYGYNVLRAVESAGVSAPRPLFVDTAGEIFGCPATVTTYLPGRPWIPRHDDAKWTEGLARAAFSVHKVILGRSDLSALAVYSREKMRERIRGFEPKVVRNPFAMEVYAALLAGVDKIELLPPTLVHGDFWAGNVVWHRRRLAGIIDWADAFVGDPRADIGECRGDLVMSHGRHAADRFRDQYEALSGRQLRDLWFFDLYVGINALVYYRHWILGYHDLGFREITAAETGPRLRAHLKWALKEAGV